MEQYQSAITWAWNNHNPPAQIECIFYPVDIDFEEALSNPGKVAKFRLNKTGNECVVEAIRAARAGDRSLALRWLMAAQCHNPDHRNDIKHAGENAVNYAVSQFGGQVP
ncbi:hypothetical protein [Methylobacterium fujisawaense]|uniref:hypothetical protein n=1 Tax=Methylobacterium fujisawaense TaxID=107400 RepID=UPI00313F1979